MKYDEAAAAIPEGSHRLSAEGRVAFFEKIFDELSAAIQAEGSIPDELQDKVLLLERYYTSGQWRADYEADEAGLFPADLKRGVLSQDGVYDLLELCRNEE